MTRIAYGRIRDRLGQRIKREQETVLQARCPAHDDKAPSLTVTDTATRVLMHCHAHCDIDSVLNALDLTKADLYDEKKVEYRYDNGRSVYRNTEKKTFWQSLPLDDKIPRLYHLSRLQESGDAIIYLVEGEEDVHAIEAIGGVATTAPAGASNFAKVDLEPLRGRRVVAVVDKDSAGDRWAEQVLQRLTGVVSKLWRVEAATGKDASDHIAAGHTLQEWVKYQPPQEPEPEPEPTPEPPPGSGRVVTYTRASDIKPRPVHWLWQDRIALGTLALLAGREGIGKSTIAYWLASRVTRGELPGARSGKPMSVAVAATEDSWEHTIVPRLMGAGADLERVLRVEVHTVMEGVTSDLILPRDLEGLEALIRDVGVGLVLLDPLTSRMGHLDTHKDAEVRQALEPLVAVGDRTQAAIIGLIHVNKSGGTDPLTQIMGSRAFAAVARAVLFAIKDPDDESKRYLGQPKNNLGRTDLPSLMYSINETVVAETEDGLVTTAVVEWGDQVAQSVRDLLEATEDVNGAMSSVAEAGTWLIEFLAQSGGCAHNRDIKDAGRKEGHNENSLKRAKKRHKVADRSVGYPRTTWWCLPGADTVSATSPVSVPTDPIDPTDPTLFSQLQ